MSWKGVFRKIAALALLAALGYALYTSGVGEWVRQNVLHQTPGDGGGGGNASNRAEGPEEETGQEEPEDVKFTLKEFSREMRGEKSGEVEARVSGEKFVRQREDLYHILSPVVTSLMETMAGEGEVDVQMDRVRLTAENAVFDESKSEVELHNSVTARGKDFRITTERVTYNAASQKVSGTRLVRMERYRTGPDGQKSLSMVVTGRGLEGDLVLRSVTVPASVEATLLGVSEDFMASGEPADTEEEDGGQKIVIRSEGPMTYKDGTRQVIFQQNVRVSTGGKILRAERLEVNLGENKGEERLSVTGVTATENVRMKFRDQVATGVKLVWQNVTQAGVLTGEPARLEGSRFSITGNKLTFVRLDNRLQVQGAGRLVRKAVGGGKKPAEDDPAGSMPLSADAPIEVTWSGGMTYEAAGPHARFEKDVHARQADSDLTCDYLDLRFGQNNRLQQVRARDGVVVREKRDGVERWMKCAEAAWEAEEGVIRMKAAEKEQVAVQAGEEKLFSPIVHYAPETNMFDCPAPGRLLISGRPATEEQGGRDPMEVTWKESMHYDRSGEPKATFRGGVQVVQPERSLSAQTLHVMFNEERRPVRIAGEGDAVLEVRRAKKESEGGAAEEPEQKEEESSEDVLVPAGAGTDWRLKADRMVGLLSEDRLEVPVEGDLEVLRPDAENDWIRWKDRMHADFEESYARFDGNVRARFGGSELESGALRLDFNEERELRHINCIENVHFRSVGEQPWTLEARSAEAIFAPGSVLSQIIARDDVVVHDAQRRLRSQFLTLFFRRQKGTDQQALSRAVARRNVRVRYTGDTDLNATCERLDWDAESDRYRLTGDPARLTKEDMELDGETIVVDRRSGRVSLPGGKTPGRTAIEEQPD